MTTIIPPVPTVGSGNNVGLYGQTTTGNVVIGPGGGSSTLTGNLNANFYWINNLRDPILPQDAATKAYVDAGGGGGNGKIYYPGMGIVFSGAGSDIIDANVDDVNIIINGSNEIAITTQPTFANVTATNFFGTATAALTAATAVNATVAASANMVAGANVTGQVANALVSGTVYTAAQPNITSVGTLGNLAVTGNVNAGFFIGDGGFLSNIAGDYSNANVANYLPVYTGNLGNVNNITTSGNALVGGNLIVSGNLVYVNVDTFRVEDPIIELGRGPNGAPLTLNDGKDRGVDMWYYDTAERQAFFGYDNSTGKLIAAKDVSITSEIVTVNNYGNFVVGNVEAATVVASGNITGDNFIGALANGTTYVDIPVVNDDIVANVNGARYVTLARATNGNSYVAIGSGAGTGFTGDRAVFIGTNAGNNPLATGGPVAIGHQAASNAQGNAAVAIGGFAGANLQGANAVAIGSSAGNTSQGANSVAVGRTAGFTTQAANSVAVGAYAGQTTQAANSVAVGFSAGNDNQGELSVSVGRGAGDSNQGASSVAVGAFAGQVDHGANSVAVGQAAGQTTQGANAVAVGRAAGITSQSESAVAVGYVAGQINQGENAVAVGRAAGNVNQSLNAVAVGMRSGNDTQGASAIAIGYEAGLTTQGANSVAIGLSAASTSQLANSVAIGLFAGSTNQGANSIAIGTGAGNVSQGNSTISIGVGAGANAQGAVSIAIGQGAAGNALANQSANSIAIGRSAGFTSQGLRGIAIGQTAGFTNQGANSIAIGWNAGVTNQSANSIAINATGVVLNPANSGTYIAPLRNVVAPNSVYYNTATKELTYATIQRFNTFVSSPLSIPANTNTTVLFTSSGDPNGWYNAATGRFQPTIAGTYLITYSVTWQSAGGSGNQQQRVDLAINGLGFQSIFGQVNHSVPITLNSTLSITLNGTTDYVEIVVNTSTNLATQNISGGTFQGTLL